MRFVGCLAFVLLITLSGFGQEISYESPAQRPGAPGVQAGLYKGSVAANWFDRNTRFWYRNDLADNLREFIVVNAQTAERRVAFDHAELARALSKTANVEVSAARLPFDVIQFINDNLAVRFTAFGKSWDFDLQAKECVLSQANAAPATLPSASRTGRGGFDPAAMGGVGSRGGRGAGGNSQSGQYGAFVRNNNIFIRDAGGTETQLSTDGTAQDGYVNLQWSPDSRVLTAFRRQPGDNKEVYRLQSSPSNGGRAVLQREVYLLPGDKLDSYELNLFVVADQKQIKPDIGPIDMDPGGYSPNPRARFKSDGRHFTIEKFDRGHQRVRLIECDSHTGEVRNIVDEKSETFIWSAHTEDIPGMRIFTYLNDENRVLYMSEESGWRHIYLYTVEGDKIEKSAVTKGNWVVRGYVRVDEANNQIYFSATGVYAGQDPYLVHYGRVNFDGTGLVFLTQGNGNHSIAWSPDNQYLIDTYSRVDEPPVTELRRVSDGKLVVLLEKAELANPGAFNPTEVFVAKGRDHATDIWGIICRPRDFDPTKKYPVIEYIYAGPQGSFVPKTFSLSPWFEFLTRLGFIVVQCDAMGTANRSKAFHDVCWKNLKDGGFPDRIAWITAAAAKYPYMDISKVGIYGTSAGGQNAAAGVLFHGDFYKAAIANSGCHDNRMDKVSWNEQWMGYPVGPQYSESSNIDHAANLQGSLMLIVGELDNNVPPESTYRFVDALIRAKKEFDFVMVPNANHGAANTPGASDFINKKEQDFFLRTLKGEMILNRNGN